MKQGRGFLRQVFICIGIAAAIAVLVTVLGSVPPLSVIYDRTAGSSLNFVWTGLVAGVISLGLTAYWAAKRKD